MGVNRLLHLKVKEPQEASSFNIVSSSDEEAEDIKDSGEAPVVQPPSASKAKVKVSKRRALALQKELLVAFGAPDFQKALHELARIHNDPKGVSREFASGFCKLVRSRQVEIIPRYGYDGSEEGVEEMLRTFKEMEGDPDIYINEVAIKEALSLEVLRSPQTSDVVPAKPISKERVLELLRLHLAEFSKAFFQHKLEDLKKAADRSSGRWSIQDGEALPDPEGYFHLPGRADLAFRVQKKFLPRYGFAATKDGVKEMICHCAKYLSDPDVEHLFDSLNSKLGMSSDACERFRRMASQLDFQGIAPST